MRPGTRKSLQLLLGMWDKVPALGQILPCALPVRAVISMGGGEVEGSIVGEGDLYLMPFEYNYASWLGISHEP